MAGRKPKPTPLKRLEGNPGKRPLPDEMDIPADKLTCPAHLTSAARREWKRVVPELQALGLLTNVDRAALAAYCQAYGRWVEAEKVLKQKGPLYKTEKGNVITSPMLWVSNKAVEQMHKFLTEFGFTPASRVRLSVTPKSTKDPMDELLDWARESTEESERRNARNRPDSLS